MGEAGAGRSPYAARKHDHHNPLAGGKLVPTDALDVAGTPSADTFLRGDNTWATPPTTPVTPAPPTAAPQPQSVPFSYAGALALSTSPPWMSAVGGALRKVIVLLGTAGSSNTVVTAYVNGASVGTVTLASGVTQNSVTLDAPLVADTDLLTMGITTAGTGAKDLDVLARVA